MSCIEEKVYTGKERVHPPRAFNQCDSEGKVRFLDGLKQHLIDAIKEQRQKQQQQQEREIQQQQLKKKQKLERLSD